MRDYFTIHTYTPWDSLKTGKLTQIKLISLKSIFESFPVIEKKFFKDLVKLAYNNTHYSWDQCIRRIVGPNSEDYSIDNFSFIWAFDDQNRMFQFLFQKIDDKKDISQCILVALAPPELGQLLTEHQREALIKTLSLLNKPSRIRFLMMLAPKGKSIAEENQIFQINQNQLDKLKYVNTSGNMPNISGNWFPMQKVQMKDGSTYNIVKDPKLYIEARKLLEKIENNKKKK